MKILKKPLVLLGLIAYLNLLIAFTYVNNTTPSYIGNPLEFNSDTITYLNTVDYFRGSLFDYKEQIPEQPEPIILTRALTTPLMVLAAMFIGQITGNDAFGMIAINIILYFLLVPILYRTGVLVFKESKTAIISTILVLTNWCLFSFGTALTVDLGGWFFFLLTSMFALEYYRNPSERKYFYYAIFSSIVGVFFKEYGALGMITLGLLVLIGTNSWKQKVKDICIATLLFGTVFFGYHLWFYFQFDFTYFSWYEHNYDTYANPTGGKYTYQIPHLIKVLALIFLLGWPLFLLGAIRLLKEIHIQGKERLYVLAAMLPASLTFLAWPAFAHRIAFILIPWAALVAAYGLSWLKNRWLVAFILLTYILFSYNVDVLTASFTLG